MADASSKGWHAWWSRNYVKEFQRTTIIGETMTGIDQYKAILVDLDGCLIAGSKVLPGADKLVASASHKLYIVSNNSTDTPDTLSRRLEGLGLSVPPHRIILAGVLTLERIADSQPGARIALYGTTALRDYAISLGLAIDEQAPDLILLARDLAFSFDKLSLILRQLHGGARLVVSNPDLVHPGPNGIPAPETGAVLAAVKACVKDLQYESVGKPAVHLFESALTRAGVRAEDALFIGDNLETDGAGARSAKIAFHHVATGSADLTALTVAD